MGKDRASRKAKTAKLTKEWGFLVLVIFVGLGTDLMPLNFISFFQTLSFLYWRDCLVMKSLICCMGEEKI